MFCPTCGKETPEDAVFCNHCGSSMSGMSSYLASGEGASPARTTNQLAVDTHSFTDDRSQQPSSSPLWPIQQPLDSGSSPSQPLFLPPTGPISSATGSWSNQSVPLPQGSMIAPHSPTPVSVPPNAIQRMMVRVFQPALASNALFAIALGSILAIVVGVGTMAAIIGIVHGIADKTANYGLANFDAVIYQLQMIALHAPFRDSVQLFLVAQGVGLHIQYGSGTGISTISSLEPLHGFLIIPALLLTFGGYIAACSDFQNNARTSLLRGAAIALPYTVLLFILSLQVNGPVLDPNGTLASDASILTMDNLTLLLFGLLWGVLFGTLGASIKLGSGQWRGLVHTYLATRRNRQVTGMIVGGLASTGVGISLALIAVLSLVAYSAFSTPLLLNPLCYSADWRDIASWSLAQGPLYAVNLFAFSFGAPITFTNQLASQSCFFTNAPHATLSLFDSTLILSGWRYLFLLLPALSLFIGGRVSVAVARIQGIGPAMIQGAIIAAPFTILMIFFTLISTITYTTIGGPTAQNATTALPTIQSAGVGILDMLLWALLSGAVFGALGGMYQDSRMKAGVSKFLATLAFPFLFVCRPIFALFDRITGHYARRPQDHAYVYLYSALLVTLLLLIASIVAGLILINMNAVITIKTNQQIKDIVSIALIALPGLLLLCAASSALATNPSTVSAEQAQPLSASPSPYIQGVQ